MLAANLYETNWRKSGELAYNRCFGFQSQGIEEG